MILNIFAVYDRQGECFAAPMFIPMAGQAVRSFTDEVNRSSPENPLFMHPDDFDLYRLGAFDTDKGKFIVSGDPEVLALGKNVKLNGK